MGKPNVRRKPVLQYTLDGKFVREFDSVSQANVEMTGKVDGHINDVCNGKRLNAYGYIWKWKTINK